MAGGASALMQTEKDFDAPDASQLSSDEVSFVQVRAHSRSKVAPLEAPEMEFGGKKDQKSGGVMALMDMMVNDLKATTQEAKFAEKQAQKDYVELMKESQEKRAADQKAIVDQSGAKAELESSLAEAKENQQLTMAEPK